ncbi:uncharacterized protein LOC119688185 [Teleopsis dalmanni]|uniref:uncharacterized protein LOC119688185 n=1 Tax=Teleopsis dalmanni TaxID=139649 RepID=UPI0018CF5CE2|nr:uncharacterized protein LOC119688185 [Teleopsis dalmanni]
MPRAKQQKGIKRDLLLSKSEQQLSPLFQAEFGSRTHGDKYPNALHTGGHGGHRGAGGYGRGGRGSAGRERGRARARTGARTRAKPRISSTEIDVELWMGDDQPSNVNPPNVFCTYIVPFFGFITICATILFILINLFRKFFL